MESLGGRYVTACDVGTYVADMDVVGEETRYATGRSEADGGAGDSSVLTAYGVFQGMRASAAARVGQPDPAPGARWASPGSARSGGCSTAHLLEDGAHVVVTDVSEQAVEAVRATYPQVDVAPTPRRWCTGDLDVYAPCALGGALDDATVESLSATIVCGGGQQPAGRRGRARHRRPAAGARHHLRARLPGQRRRRDPGQRRAARLRASSGPGQGAPGSSTTPRRVLRLAAERGISPAVAADRIAEERMSGVGNPNRIWLPAR